MSTITDEKLEDGQVSGPPADIKRDCQSKNITVQAGEFYANSCELTANGELVEVIVDSNADEKPLRGLVYFEQFDNEEKMTVELVDWSE